VPDRNKFAELCAAGFTVRATCGRCLFYLRGSPTRAHAAWGTCERITYKHEKHTGPRREASVPHDGWCPGFEVDPKLVAGLGAHGRFLNEDTAPSIVCPTCGRRSYNANDIKYRYCGACNLHHSDAPPCS
jgi:ribosomal protein L37E